MEKLEKHFNFLQSIKKDDYSIDMGDIVLPDGKVITPNLASGLVVVDEFATTFEAKETIVFDETPERNPLYKTLHWVVPQEAVDYLYPDNLDVQEFWKKSVETFPFFSISGNVPTVTNKNEANEVSFKSQRFLKSLDWLDEGISSDSKILEIGPGYGMVYEKVIKSYAGLESNYYSIDVNPLFHHENAYQCDGRNIPQEIPNDLDIVYSVNVFQHLSSSQRKSYYKQIFDKLKPGGKFIVGTFCITQNNVSKPLWGHSDGAGNFYAFFLGQYTEIEYIGDWGRTLVEEFGFKITKAVEADNYVCFELKKPQI